MRCRHHLTAFVTHLALVSHTSQVNLLWTNGGEPDASCDLLKLVSSVLTLWLVAFLIVYYRRKFEQLKVTNVLLPQDTLISSGLLISAREWSLVPEAILCSIHAPPFICTEVVVHYFDLRRGTTLPTVLSSDEIAAVCMMFARLILVVRYLPYMVGLTAKTARAFANFNHLPLTTWLSIRVTYQRFPVRLLGSTTLLLLAMFAFTLQVCSSQAESRRLPMLSRLI